MITAGSRIGTAVSGWRCCPARPVFLPLRPAGCRQVARAVPHRGWSRCRASGPHHPRFFFFFRPRHHGAGLRSRTRWPMRKLYSHGIWRRPTPRPFTVYKPSEALSRVDVLRDHNGPERRSWCKLRTEIFLRHRPDGGFRNVEIETPERNRRPIATDLSSKPWHHRRASSNRHASPARGRRPIAGVLSGATRRCTDKHASGSSTWPSIRIASMWRSRWSPGISSLQVFGVPATDSPQPDRRSVPHHHREETLPCRAQSPNMATCRHARGTCGFTTVSFRAIYWGALSRHPGRIL